MAELYLFPLICFYTLLGFLLRSTPILASLAVHFFPPKFKLDRFCCDSCRLSFSCCCCCRRSIGLCSKGPRLRLLCVFFFGTFVLWSCVCVCVCVYFHVLTTISGPAACGLMALTLLTVTQRGPNPFCTQFFVCFFCFVFFYRVFPFDGSGVAALARSYCVLPRFSLRPSSVQDCLVRYRALKTEPKMAELFFYTEFYLFF